MDDWTIPERCAVIVNKRKTKIICTLGPSSSDSEVISGLIVAGMNVARLNFSHGTHESHAEILRALRAAADKTTTTIASMLDTKGPEIRTGPVLDNGVIEIRRGDEITLTSKPVLGTDKLLSVSYKQLPNEVAIGNHIYIADGLIDLEVVEVAPPEIKCVVRMGGNFGGKKNVNIPGVRSTLPGMTEKDKDDIRFGIEHEMDIVAASFIRKAEHVAEIRRFTESLGTNIRIVAKIEDQEGVDNIDEIIRVADGIMIARGDLGVQLPTEQVPLVQKRIAVKANSANRAVIVATQMLDSMIQNSRPTRAELTDVANAIFDGADSVMLSGETASGAFPIESVRTMDRIASTVEASPEYRDRVLQTRIERTRSADISESFARSACLIADSVGATAIICPSLRGNTPKRVSKYRPSQTIIAATTSAATARKLLLYSGIFPILTEIVEDSDTMIHNAIRVALEGGIISRFDRLVSVAGVPINSPIMMNTIRFHVLGTILARGVWGRGRLGTGQIVKIDSESNPPRLCDADIALVGELRLELAEVLRNAAGIIVESRIALSEAVLDSRFTMPIVSEIVGAVEQFEDGATVTIDGNEKIVYEGVMIPNDNNEKSL